MVNVNSQEVIISRSVAISFVTNSDIVARNRATKSNHETAVCDFTVYGNIGQAL